MTLNGVIFRACTGWNKGNVANKSHGSTIRVTRVQMLKNLTVKQTQKIFLWKPRPFLFVISVSIAMHRLQIINQELKIYCQNCKSRKSLENWAWDAFVCNTKPNADIVPCLFQRSKIYCRKWTKSLEHWYYCIHRRGAVSYIYGTLKSGCRKGRTKDPHVQVFLNMHL